MSTLFILWPVAIDATFRPAYAALTGETIQDTPGINISGDMYMVGSSRVSESACETLKSQFPALIFGIDPAVLGWIEASEIDIFQAL